MLDKNLLKHLRSGRPTGRNIRKTVALQRRPQIQDCDSIRERPAEVQDRAVPGHWEGGFVVGVLCTQMATLAERPCRFIVLAELDRRDMITESAGLSRERINLAQQLRRSPTRDRAMEFADHNKLTSTQG